LQPSEESIAAKKNEELKRLIKKECTTQLNLELKELLRKDLLKQFIEQFSFKFIDDWEKQIQTAPPPLVTTPLINAVKQITMPVQRPVKPVDLPLQPLKQQIKPEIDNLNHNKRQPVTPPSPSEKSGLIDKSESRPSTAHRAPHNRIHQSSNYSPGSRSREHGELSSS